MGFSDSGGAQDDLIDVCGLGITSVDQIDTSVGGRTTWCSLSVGRRGGAGRLSRFTHEAADIGAERLRIRLSTPALRPALAAVSARRASTRPPILRMADGRPEIGQSLRVRDDGFRPISM